MTPVTVQGNIDVSIITLDFGIPITVTGSPDAAITVTILGVPQPIDIFSSSGPNALALVMLSELLDPVVVHIAPGVTEVFSDPGNLPPCAGDYEVALN